MHELRNLKVNSPEQTQNQMTASVVIASRNRSEDLRRCLRSLRNMKDVRGEWQVIVVDNNSNDATRDVVLSFDDGGTPPVLYFYEGRCGKSAALNTGIAQSSGAIVAFTDDDCLPDQHWLHNLLIEFEIDPDLALLGGRVELYDERDQKVSLVQCNQRTDISPERIFRALFGGPSDTAEYGSVIGANMAVRRSAFSRLGLFDVFLAPGSTRIALAVEDSDFVYRASQAGLKIGYSPEPLVYHNHGRRTDTQADATIVGYNRGRGAFYFKHCLSGDLRVAKAAYWELKGYCKTLCSRKTGRAKRRNIWRIIRALSAGFRTQFVTLGCDRVGMPLGVHASELATGESIDARGR